MQGKGTEKEARISFILMLFVFLSLTLAGISCAQWDKEEKEYIKKHDSFFKYEEGDIIYLKPDSTIGVITDRTLWNENKKEYRVRYSTKVGKIEYLDILEPSIFGKK